MAKQAAARKHLGAARSWKLIRNANINVSRSIPTAVTSIEKLNPSNTDCCAIVDGDPGQSVAKCVAKVCVLWVSLCVSIYATGSRAASVQRGKGGCHRLQLYTCV